MPGEETKEFKIGTKHRAYTARELVIELYNSEQWTFSCLDLFFVCIQSEIIESLRAEIDEALRKLKNRVNKYRLVLRWI